ncbi:UNVERIFIED_CONTAM: hypothetical protein RMT77_009941 [Armadillidium vulgare]
MDCSIEIIGEVIPEKSSKEDKQENEFEVVYDASASKKVIQDSTPLRRRPLRQRKPIRLLREEQQLEEPKKRKSLLKPKKSRLRPLLKMGLSENQTSSPASGKMSGMKQTMKGVKRKSEEFSSGSNTRKNLKTQTTVNKRKKTAFSDVEIIFEWDPSKVIAERQGVEEWQAKNVINMFDQENTLPFIARYRKEKTGNMEVEKLREIQNSYSQLKQVQEKVSKIIKSDNYKIPEDRKACLLHATSLHEVEHLTAAFKGSSKRTYAERARELGLDPPATEILLAGSPKYMHRQELLHLTDSSKEGLRSVDEVEQGLQHIIADVISKDPKVMDFAKNLMRTCRPVLECTKKRQQNKEKASAKSKSSFPSQELCAKYENYFQYKNIAWNTRPHQILAMNRGENQNVLSLKIVIPDAAYRQFLNFCIQMWLITVSPQQYRYQLIIKSIEDSWERLVKPFMQRQIRSHLTESAEIASVEVFTSNLKKLLLTPPVRGKSILAFDPGFQNGCKIGVTNPQGEVLLTTTIYPFRKKEEVVFDHWTRDHNARTLREIVLKHCCEYFAIGNGTACREMEKYLSWLISSGCFEPYNIQYTIINESGVSQYSVSPEAKQEFPNMDVNHISAVSLARRLQDPLLEYVKVHPMHLGVGMYQHDIPEKLLHTSLDSVMTECVSFVGLDINVASDIVLRKLSGLNKTRAANIVEHRKLKGPFVNREQIKSVKGIGPRTFEQCAGFIRIMPETLEEEFKKTPSLKKNQRESPCPLDRTMVHPESYDVAFKFMNLCNVKAQNIGSEGFLRTVQQFSRTSNLEMLAKQCSTSIHTMQLIIEGLSQPLDFDIRAQFDKPLFRKGITSIDDLILGSRLTGTVRNTTHFGAFVDIGVGIDGLIHLSGMRGMRIELGTNVEVSVRSLDKERKRIGLSLERVL